MRHLAVALVVLIWSPVAWALDITTCDQLVPAGQVGEVQNDLDCGAGSFASAVRLDNRATLHLNGHRINGPTTGDGLVLAVKSATIVGPGEIDTAPDGACIVSYYGSLHVDGGPLGLDVHNCFEGIAARVNAKISNVTIHDNTQEGAFAARLTVTNVSANRNSSGVAGVYSLRATNLTAADNTVAGFIGENTAVIKDSNISGSGNYGGDGRRVVLTNTAISNSANWGVRAQKALRLRNSSVTGTGPGNGDVPPNTDLESATKPILFNSTCGKSDGPDGTWGVCAND
jgi:hypothetical protein